MSWKFLQACFFTANLAAFALLLPGMGLIMTASPGWAGPPPNPTQSDANVNTAGGSGALLHLSSGYDNTAFGKDALFDTTSGADNSAFGEETLSSNTTGSDNTADGASALSMNTIGLENTATGFQWLGSNVSGNFNTAAGAYSLPANTSGNYNTASGFVALYRNTTGSFNTADGAYAMAFSHTGTENTACGAKALYSNASGADNTAVGVEALENSTIGSNNTVTGASALPLNSIGNNNTADGFQALFHNLSGSGNIALGAGAGINLQNGSNNIYLGNGGAATESNTTRIGTAGKQTRTFVAGVFGAGVSGGTMVLVNSAGQLGVQSSSARYKADIKDMGESSQGLMKLRPVTFRYKEDPGATREYGLIAEEVARVYPELVTMAGGRVESVRYHELIAMLLNELQKQAVELGEQTRKNQEQADQNRRLSARLDALQQQLTAQRVMFDRRLGALEQMTADKGGGAHKLAAAFDR